MKFSQKQDEPTNCSCIITLALPHFTEGKKKTFPSNFFSQWILLLSQVGTCLKNLSDGRFIMYEWGGGKATQGQILIPAALSKYTELRPVKMRHFNVLCAPTGERYAVKRVRNVSVRMCAHACTDSAALPLLPAGKKTFLGSFRTVCVPCDGPQPRDFQVFLLASNL